MKETTIAKIIEIQHTVVRNSASLEKSPSRDTAIGGVVLLKHETSADTLSKLKQKTIIQSWQCEMLNYQLF